MALQKWRSARLVVLISALLIASDCRGADAPMPRKWKDASGKFEIEATFVGMNADKVTLKQLDGQVMEIEMQLLSPADAAYAVEQLVNTVRAQQRPTAASAPKPASIRWAGVRELAPPAKNRWEEIRIEPPVVKKAKSARLPISRDISEEFTNIVAGNGFAILGFKRPEHMGVGSTRLIRVNLEDGKVEGAIVTEGVYALMDVSPTGEEILMRKEGLVGAESADLEIWRPAGKVVERKKAFTPFAENKTLFNGVDTALFGANGRIVVLSSGRAGIFDTATGEAIASTPAGYATSVSSDRKYAAILGESLFIVDLASGETLASLPMPFVQRSSSSMGLAFSPDGKRLAAGCGPSLVVWELQNGDVYRDETLQYGVSSNDDLIWTSPSHILIGRTLIDLENRLPLWFYTCDHAFSQGESTVIVSEQAWRDPVLTAAVLPHPAAVAAGRQAMAAGDLFAVKPGTAVSVDVSALSDAAEQKKAKAGLESRLIAAGLKPQAGAPIVLKATMGSAGRQQEFRPFAGRGKTETVNATEYTSKVELLVGGKSAWEHSSTTMASTTLLTRGNESAQEAANKTNRPNWGFFSEVKIPQYVLKPGKGHFGVDGIR